MIDNQLQANADGEHPETEQSALTVAVQETHLINYDTARRALAEAVRVDEIKAIHDQAMALKACAKIAKDQQMELDAAEIRVRAQRRLGEILVEQGKTVGKAKGAKGIGTSAGYKKTRTADAPPTLDEAGIDKNLAHRARKAANLSQKEFDKEVAEMRKGNRGSLNIRRAAKPVKRTVVGADDADRRADEVLVHISPKSHRSSFLARVETANDYAQYKGRLEPGWANEFAILARNVAATWSALAAQLEQAARDANEQPIAKTGDDEHGRG